MSALVFALWLAAAQAPPAPEQAPPPPTPAELQAQIDQLRAQLESLEKRQDWMATLSAKLSGYLDVGFFWVQGNGSGVRKDFGGTLGYRGQILDTWVLKGDPLSTTINSRGDVADVGDSRAIRFDPVHAGNRPSFIVNAINLGLNATLTDSFGVVVLFDFIPRDRDISDGSGVFLGDYFDLKLAHVRWELERRWLVLVLTAGKVDSLLGVEYRTQEASNRITVTPSLLCRYTCGRPVGVRANAELFDGKLEVGLALTNGSSQVEFFPFTNETDFNHWKTLSGKLAVHLPVGRDLELNATGAVGSQDRQGDDSVLQWHYGFAGLLEWRDFIVAAEFVSGRANGKHDGAVQCGLAPCFGYRGAYGLVAWQALRMLMPYARVDWRHARHVSGTSFAYVSDVLRATFGLRADLHANVALKAEYTFNNELSPLASFPDDVFTTSLVVRY